MFNDIATTVVMIAAIVAAYYAILIFCFKKVIALPTRKSRGAAGELSLAQINSGDFPQLIDRPAMETEEKLAVTLGKQKESKENEMVMVEDEESVLLKAAEIVVEKVQDVVNHIASSPPNPEEVFTKIRAIVNQYQIFHDTEYFDAINSFIAVTVARDCGIKLTKDELLSLWK